MGKTAKPRSKAPPATPLYSQFEVVMADAIEFRKQNPTESFAKIAAQFPPLSAETIHNRYNGRSSKANSGGHNKLLTDEEERGIIKIIERYTFIGTPLRLDLLRSVAVRVLKK
jgi:hypothetical protein